MAGLPTYVNDLVTIATGDLNYDAGTWDESSDGGWDTAGAMVDDTNLQYTKNNINTGEAVPSCTSAQYTKDGIAVGATGPGTIMYLHTTAFTVPTDGVVIPHHLWAAPDALNPYEGTFLTAEAGIAALIGDSFGDFDVHYLSGNNKSPAPEGGWATYVIDPTITPDGTVGAPTVISMVGISVAAVAQARGNPQAMQAIRYGRAEVTYTNGEVATPAKFEGYAVIDNAPADRFNLLKYAKKGYESRGLMTFGTGVTPVYFNDSDVSIVIEDDPKVGPNFNGGVVNNALSELHWVNVSISYIGTVAKWTFKVNDGAVTSHTGGVFEDMGTYEYGINSTNVGVTYRRQEAVSGGSYSKCKFESSVAASAVINTPLGSINDCEFTWNILGYAVNAGTVDTVDLPWNNITSGYTAPEAVNGEGVDISVTPTGNEDILVHVNAGQILRLNVSSTATEPSVANTGTGEVYVISGQVTMTMVGHPVGATVLVYDLDSVDPQDLGTELARFDNAAASVQYQYSGGKAGDDVQVKAIEPGYRTFTKPTILSISDSTYNTTMTEETN